METLRSILLASVAAMVALGTLMSPSSAAWFDPGARAGDILLAGSDCYSIGEQVAAEYGGTLARASQATQDGQPVCVIVVLVPGKDGQRPRRTEVVVPQG